VAGGGAGGGAGATGVATSRVLAGRARGVGATPPTSLGAGAGGFAVCEGRFPGLPCLGCGLPDTSTAARGSWGTLAMA